jgi:Ca2+-binding RTX toxin-like protein
MSIINGENIQVIGGAYTNTHGTAQAAGIDIEANDVTAVPGNHNILIRGVTFSGNDGYGVELSAKGLPTNITVEGCYFTNNDLGGIQVGTAWTMITANTFENFSQSERGLIDLGAAQTNSNNVVTGNSFNNISTGQPVIYAHNSSGTNNQVYSNDFYNISGPMLESHTSGTTGWDNEITSSPTYPTSGNLINGTSGDDQLVATANNDSLLGQDGNDLLFGEAGADSLSGGAGSDSLTGGAGADTMDGGVGNDTYLVDSLADQIVEGSGGGTDEIRSTVALTTQTAFVENYTFLGTTAVNFLGNSAANRITGTAAADTLNGNGGDDTLIGGVGSDSLTGGVGNDSLTGGVGNDTYVVDGATDKISETGSDPSDTVQATIAIDLSLAVFAGIENVTLTGTSAINATGSGIANRLVGNNSANVLDGGGGSDTLEGGKGNDTYFVDSLADQVIENTGGGTDEIRSTVTLTKATAYVEDYTFLAATAVNFTGNSGANRITGTASADTLNGNGGDDTLIGGAGDNLLVGGNGNDQVDVSAGNDTIRYTSLLDGSDVVSGFDGNPSGGQDALNLDALFDSLGIAAANRATRLSVATQTTSVDVSFDADGNGSFESVIVTLNTTDAIAIGDDIVLGT